MGENKKLKSNNEIIKQKIQQKLDSASPSGSGSIGSLQKMCEDDLNKFICECRKYVSTGQTDNQRAYNFILQLCEQIELDQTPAAPAATERDPVMQDFLDKEPALARFLLDAVRTGRYFVTVTMQKKDSAEDKNDLKHFWTRQGLSANDVTSSLRHLLKDYNSKENPNALIDDGHSGNLY